MIIQKGAFDRKMKRLVQILAIIFCMISVFVVAPVCNAFELIPIYENSFDEGVGENWKTSFTNPVFSSFSVFDDGNGNIYGDVAGAINNFKGGSPLTSLAYVNLDCGKNYTINMKMKISDKYEYAGIPFRSNDDGSVSYFVLDYYTNSFCLSNNLYSNTSFISGTRVSYSLVADFSPKNLNDYKIVSVGDKIRAYVNDTLVIEYTDKDGVLKDKCCVGGANLTSSSNETHTYIDDISVVTNDALIEKFSLVSGDAERNLKEDSGNVFLLPEGFKISVLDSFNDIDFAVIETESRDEIPFTILKKEDTYVIFKPDTKLKENTTYSLLVKKISFDEGSFEGFSEIPFITASGIVTTTAVNDENGLTVTMATTNRSSVSAALIIAAVFEDGNLKELQSQEAKIKAGKKNVTLEPFKFTAKGDSIVIYTWKDILGSVMYTEPLVLEVAE